MHSQLKRHVVMHFQLFWRVVLETDKRLQLVYRGVPDIGKCFNPECPQGSPRHGSVGSCTVLRSKASVCDSTKLYDKTRDRPEFEPRGLQGMVRWEQQQSKLRTITGVAAATAINIESTSRSNSTNNNIQDQEQ